MSIIATPMKMEGVSCLLTCPVLGQAPPRHFGNRGEISPPSGRHWMYNQAGIDKALSEKQDFIGQENGVPRLKKFLDESDGMPASDIWDDIQPLRSWHKRTKTTGYSTQKTRSPP